MTIVAGGSTKKPIVAIIGKASGGNPYRLTIKYCFSFQDFHSQA
ncbi:MAG: hypothetical protein ACRC76_00620 [Proteocatella sp.]